jgi:hypothetical protein
MKRAALLLALVAPVFAHAQYDQVIWRIKTHERPVVYAFFLRELAWFDGPKDGSRSAGSDNVAVVLQSVLASLRRTETRIADGAIDKNSWKVKWFWRDYFWLFDWFSVEFSDELGQATDLDDYKARVLKLKQGFAKAGIQINDRYANFADVPENHWADDAIHNLRKLGILRGYPDNTFRG